VILLECQVVCPAGTRGVAVYSRIAFRHTRGVRKKVEHKKKRVKRNRKENENIWNVFALGKTVVRLLVRMEKQIN
jgi:ribosomal silencing factor RsfS